MKKSVLLLSAVLLAFSASAQADVIGINYASVSMGVLQYSPYSASVLLASHSGLHLIPTAIYGLSPVILLSPALTPHLVVTSPVILPGSLHILPSFGTTIIGVQSVMMTSQQDASITMITDIH